MKFRRAVCALCLICVGCAVFAFSQEKSSGKQDKPAEHKEFTTRANVLILDAAGKTVGNVKLEDLKIYEDEIEQKPTKLTKKDFSDIGIVIDRTGSMRMQINAVIATANLFADNLRDNDRAFVTTFVNRDKISVDQDWTSNRGLLKKAISNIFVEGGQSAVLDALYLSAEKLAAKKDDSRRQALVLISDCEDRDSFYKQKEVIKLLRDNNIEVYILAFTGQLSGGTDFNYKSPKAAATEFAELFASESNGAAFFPKWSNKNQSELIEAVKTIVLGLRSQYIVEYVSTNQKRGDRHRKLRVEATDSVNGEKRTILTRDKITVPKK